MTSSIARRKSLRLDGYDYSQSGFYYTTITTFQRLCTLATVEGGNVVLSSLGKVVEDCWYQIPSHFPSINLDALVIMPNHMHGIIELTDASQSRPVSFCTIMTAFKGACTRAWGRRRIGSGSVWQGNYYERIIRDEAELQKFRQYIFQNPSKWHLDKFNPSWRL